MRTAVIAILAASVPTLAFIVKTVLNRRYTDRLDKKLMQLAATSDEAIAQLREGIGR